MAVLANHDEELVQELLEVLGLKGKNVVQLELDITLDSIVVVTVERHISREEMIRMVPLFQRYKLVKKEE